MRKRKLRKEGIWINGSAARFVFIRICVEDGYQVANIIL
jgi:hypothetical protein